MSATRPTQDATAKRYERYLPIVEFAAGNAEFEVESIQQQCKSERPGFVTRVVNELVEQGWLIRENSSTTLRWNSGRGEFSVSAWLDEKIFGGQVKASPEKDRPRERLLAYGASQLRTSELLAILVRSGRPGESAVTAGDKVAKEFDGRLHELATAGRGELKAISSAIDKTAYCQIMAGIELGRRIAALDDQLPKSKIDDASKAIDFCTRHFRRLVHESKQEELHIVTLDTKNRVVDTHRITVGTLDASLAHPREVFRPAIRDAAASIILVHNHPSGDAKPSPHDVRVTDRMREAGAVVGIDVLDHIVLGKETAVSIKCQESPGR